MNATGRTAYNLSQTLLHSTGASEGTLGERDKIVLGKEGFRTSRQGAGREIVRSIKHFFTGSTGATKNRKAWEGAAAAIGSGVKTNPRIKKYIEQGKELNMRRLQKAMLNNKTAKYTGDFGMPTISTKLQERITAKFGSTDPGKMTSYRNALEPGAVNNGTYLMEARNNGSFVRFHQLSLGSEAPQTSALRCEKLHVSIHPDDMEKAYEAIAPILTAPDCPIGHWKVVNMDKARVTIIELTDKIAQMKDGPEKDGLQEQLEETMRLHEGAQFTLYAMEGQDGAEVAATMRQIEDALRTAGVRSNGTPESDEPVEGMEFTSFRIAMVKHYPGDEGYEDLAFNKGVNDGGPVCIDVRPEDPGYAQFKSTFRQNPFYQSLL